MTSYFFILLHQPGGKVKTKVEIISCLKKVSFMLQTHFASQTYCCHLIRLELAKVRLMFTILWILFISKVDIT